MRSISSKVLIYLLIVSLLPLTIVSFLLVSSANSQLLHAASAKQQAIADDLVNRVNNYLASKIDSLVYQSQVYSAGTLSQTTANENLAVLFNQDADLQRVALLNAQGAENIVFTRSGQVNVLADESGSDAFRAVKFLAGKNFVSSVSYDTAHHPLITIAVPVLASNYSQHLNDLSHANFGTYNNFTDLHGAIVANYNISDLWKSVLSTKIGQGGYAYVVDGLGNLVAHPDTNFLTKHEKLSNVAAVMQFINGNLSTEQTTSEIGRLVISTPRVISLSGWAVIVQEPVASIYAGINSYIKLSATIGLVAITMSILLSIFFGRQLAIPIKRLTLGAKKLGSGDFGQTIKIKSKDELQELAETFNKMSADIKKLVSDLQTNNINLVVEQTKLSDIISSVSDGIVALDARGKILSINPPAAKLIHRKPEEVQGKLLVNEFAWVQEGRPFSPELYAPGIYHYSDLALPNGSEIAYLDLMVSVLANQQSEVTVILTIHDLTQTRELEFMKLDFVAIAAHELRTPLTVIQGYLDMLNTKALPHLTIFDIENLQKAIVGSEQLQNLINKLLNISRIERGELEITINKIDLAKLVKDIVKQHNHTAALREQQISCNLNGDTTKKVFVPADAASIGEVLNNLLGNALKFTEVGGTVSVNLEVQGENARVTVADNGPGIPPALRARLFTKFYRAQRSLVAGSRGTGLGLFISKKIIELHHGTIGLETYNGKGSTFYFTLPVYNEARHAHLITKEKETGGIRGWFKKRPTR